MGLKDRILDFVAKWGSPTMDHPAGGGMTGDGTTEDDAQTAQEDASGQSSEAAESTSGP